MYKRQDRFGLAQLHQLRGRVGRGASKSYCLLSHQNKNKLSRQRLEVLVNSNDGFEISEIDLRFRGPGQVLGTKQSGLPDFALASLANDARAKSGKPDCFVPKTCPGPRKRKSISEISKPSLEFTKTSNLCRDNLFLF